MPSHILEILKTLIWKYENLQLSNLQNIGYFFYYSFFLLFFKFLNLNMFEQNKKLKTSENNTRK